MLGDVVKRSSIGESQMSQPVLEDVYLEVVWCFLHALVCHVCSTPAL